MRTTGWIAALASLMVQSAAAAGEDGKTQAFALRGYYFTFPRMPTYDLAAWKRIIDGVQEDGGNAVILWMAGGFRSKKHPETWEYNRDHANVRRDFARELIDHAHGRKIKVLLGFTPFGYDGVNRMSLTRPEWRATGPDGKPTAKFGFHSWGFNLCPARADVQAFMLEYVREMVRDFYPNADGLLVESSDYAGCHCKDCGARFYEHEFRFVKAVSEEMWAANEDSLVVVYPHYFSGAKVPELGLTAAKRPFDRRWALFFTPHSAPPDAGLIRQARAAIWSDDSTARRTPAEIRDAARRARKASCNGWMPSLESFTYVPTEAEEGQPSLIGKRRVPFGFGWLAEGKPPYDELPIRVNRIAYREYAQDPEMPDDRFRATLGRELFGNAATPEATAAAQAIQEAFAGGRTWCQPAPIAEPERVRTMKA
ncbi:MAG TPA: hypothetical protein VNC50_20315, partial [Planctomycetia bacterium]|nr:hypothetical protein [Planctomycetia bacterium]